MGLALVHAIYIRRLAFANLLMNLRLYVCAFVCVLEPGGTLAVHEPLRRDCLQACCAPPHLG